VDGARPPARPRRPRSRADDLRGGHHRPDRRRRGDAREAARRRRDVRDAEGRARLHPGPPTRRPVPRAPGRTSPPRGAPRGPRGALYGPPAARGARVVPVTPPATILMSGDLRARLPGVATRPAGQHALAGFDPIELYELLP